jgi:hypothetical protein
MQVPAMHCVLYHSHWTVDLSSYVFEAYMHVGVYLSSIAFQAYMHVYDVPVYPITPTELCIYCLTHIHAGPHHALRTLSLPLDCAFIFYCLSGIHARPRRACVPYHSQ